jgi:hypothetical protein
MKVEITGIILILFCLSLSAQESSYTPHNSSESRIQQLPVRQDARIDTLLQRHITQNRRLNGTEGYRLEIFFSSGMRAREQAMAVKTE